MTIKKTGLVGGGWLLVPLLSGGAQTSLVRLVTLNLATAVGAWCAQGVSYFPASAKMLLFFALNCHCPRLLCTQDSFTFFGV